MQPTDMYLCICSFPAGKTKPMLKCAQLAFHLKTTREQQLWFQTHFLSIRSLLEKLPALTSQHFHVEFELSQSF